MRHQIWLVVTISLVTLSSTVASSQRHSRADSAQDPNQAMPRLASNPADLQKRLPWPNWTVRYDSGSFGLKRGQWLKMAFVPRLPSTQISPSISVPAGELVAVESSAKTEKASAMLEGPRSGCSYARSMMPDVSKNRPEEVVAIAIMPRSISRLAERLRPKHPVRFVWNEPGEQESMVVRVNDCEYGPFIANIRWLLGSRWHEIGRELK